MQHPSQSPTVSPRLLTISINLLKNRKSNHGTLWSLPIINVNVLAQKFVTFNMIARLHFSRPQQHVAGHRQGNCRRTFFVCSNNYSVIKSRCKLHLNPHSPAAINCPDCFGWTFMVRSSAISRVNAPWLSWEWYRQMKKNSVCQEWKIAFLPFSPSNPHIGRVFRFYLIVFP